MRAAVIDLGTNTFNLLVFERDAGGALHIVHSAELPVFLGKGGIEKGVITDDAFARGIAALHAHAATAREQGATRIEGFGTSMLRNARNADTFIAAALEQCGVPITVIKGDEEAELILAGVRQARPFTNKPALVMDIGGGSIEFILATEKAMMWKRSFELGVTRLLDRIVISDPLTSAEEARIAQHLDDQLEPLWAIIERHEPHMLIGSAGSFDSLAAMIAADRGASLPADATTLDFSALEFDALRDRLLRMTRTERLLVPGLPEHRVDTIPYALVVIERVLAAGGIRDMAWSRYALKEGAAARLFGQVRSTGTASNKP